MDRPRDYYPIVRLAAGLALMVMGASAMYLTILVLEPASVEFQRGRGGGSLPYTLFMVGFGVGGVLMGRVADRVGVLAPAVVASVCLPSGLYLAAHAGAFWQFLLAIGGLCGLLGAAVTFAPLVSDITHWFNARRGLAVGILVSGTYVAGALWPPVIQRLFDAHGWRETFELFALVTLAAMLPLAVVLFRRAAVDEEAAGRGRARAARPLGFHPTALQCLVCAAGVGCCVAMSMPHVHVVPLVMDLGFSPARGAEMLALMLGTGVVSRLASGWLSDRIGGVRTMLVGGTLQCAVLVLFLGATTLPALYLVSIAFGLSQGGIVPSYAIIVRTFFPAREAGWRVGTTMLFTISGMALGGWMAGALYDLTGSYTAAFLNAIAFNVLNIAIGATFLARASRPLSPGSDQLSTLKT